MKGLLLTFLLVLSISAISQIPAPDGWKQQVSGSHYTYTPNNIFQSNFVYELMPPEKNTGMDLADWLDKAAEKTMASEGYTPASGKAERREVLSIKVYGAVVKDKSGKQWNLLMMAYQKPDNTIRYGRIIYPGNPQNNYVSTAASHFAALAKKEGAIKSDENATTSRNTEADNSNKPKETTTRTKETTPLTAPGKGLKPSEIKGVVINMEYGIGVGGMVIPEYRPYLLLQNGSIYQYPKVAPYDLDVAASRTAEPTKWGTWKQEGKTLVVTLPEKGVMKTERWDKNWFWARPTTANEKMKGEFKTIGGGGNTAMGGNAMIVVASNITFNDKGQFTFLKTAGGSNSEAGVSTSTYSNSNSAGTYTLNGYSIELRFNNGQVVRKLFYYYPDSKTTFGIGDDAYVPVD
jgi:hypothetical protein